MVARGGNGFSSKTSGKGCRKRKHRLRGRKERRIRDDLKYRPLKSNRRLGRRRKAKWGDCANRVVDAGGCRYRTGRSSKCRKIVNLKSYNESMLERLLIIHSQRSMPNLGVVNTRKDERDEVEKFLKMADSSCY